MKKFLSWLLCGTLTCGMILTGIPATSVLASGNSQISVTADNSVTVASYNDFKNALGTYKHIYVNGSLTIGGNQNASGQTFPEDIPAGTTIEGVVDANGKSTADISVRGPLQITGDNVTFKNLKLSFISGSSMGVKGHREIFLAGHSLTLDGVDMHEKGAGGSLGGFGSDEDVLLPTVYGGGFYTNTSIGSHASLTVLHSPKDSQIENIFMGNEAEANEHTAFTGSASLTLDAFTTVAGEISAAHTSQAELTITGDASNDFKVNAVSGNEQTTLRVDTSSVTDTRINNIGTVEVTNAGTLKPAAGSSLQNVHIYDNSCLDLTALPDAKINGNYTGGSASAADLIFSQDGKADIAGDVSGLTQVYITNRSSFCEDMPFPDFAYITASGSYTVDAFSFAERYTRIGYTLPAANGTWTAMYDRDADVAEIGSADVSCPAYIYTGHITSLDNGVTETSPLLTIRWKDGNGVDVTAEDAKYYG